MLAAVYDKRPCPCQTVACMLNGPTCMTAAGWPGGPSKGQTADRNQKKGTFFNTIPWLKFPVYRRRDWQEAAVRGHPDRVLLWRRGGSAAAGSRQQRGGSAAAGSQQQRGVPVRRCRHAGGTCWQHVAGRSGHNPAQRRSRSERQQRPRAAAAAGDITTLFVQPQKPPGGNQSLPC